MVNLRPGLYIISPFFIKLLLIQYRIIKKNNDKSKKSNKMSNEKG